jgi:L,D-transpeptidase ErfK/SrfK
VPLAALVCALVLGAAGARAETFPAVPDLIGKPRLYVADGTQPLLYVARANHLGVLEVMAANPGVDPWVPGEGTAVVLPTAHLLPDAPRQGIVINLAELRLYFFPPDGAAPMSFPIGIGREGVTTPLGETRIVRKKVDPTWRPTESTLADAPQLPSAVGPGPANPLGNRALYLGWPTYAVHGTNKPWGVGRRVSRGCIRLYPEDIETLYDLVPVDTPVTVVDQQVKLGWLDGELYLEVHPSLTQLDELESTGRFDAGLDADATPLILDVAGTDAGRLDWGVIRATLGQQRGIPVRITR